MDFATQVILVTVLGQSGRILVGKLVEGGADAPFFADRFAKSLAHIGDHVASAGKVAAFGLSHHSLDRFVVFQGHQDSQNVTKGLVESARLGAAARQVARPNGVENGMSGLVGDDLSRVAGAGGLVVKVVGAFGLSSIKSVGPIAGLGRNPQLLVTEGPLDGLAGQLGILFVVALDGLSGAAKHVRAGGQSMALRVDKTAVLVRFQLVFRVGTKADQVAHKEDGLLVLEQNVFGGELAAIDVQFVNFDGAIGERLGILGVIVQFGGTGAARKGWGCGDVHV